MSDFHINFKTTKFYCKGEQYTQLHNAVPPITPSSALACVHAIMGCIYGTLSHAILDNSAHYSAGFA